MKNLILVICIFAILISLQSSCKKQTETFCDGFANDEIVAALVVNGASDLADHINEAKKTNGAFFRVNAIGLGLVPDVQSNGKVTFSIIDKLSIGNNKTGFLKIGDESLNISKPGGALWPSESNKSELLSKFGSNQDVKIFNVAENSIYSQANLFLPNRFSPNSDNICIKEVANGIELKWHPENYKNFVIIFKCNIPLVQDKSFKENPLFKVYDTEDDGSFVVQKSDYENYKGGLGEFYLIRWNSGTAADSRDSSRKNVFLATSCWAIDLPLQ